MQERRREPRKDLMSYSQVYNLSDGRLLGYLGDLTLLGAMVISDQPIREGQMLSVSIELPELPGMQDASMNLTVRIAWCHQDISPDYYNLGLEFRGTTEHQKKLIQAVMDNYEFRRQAPNYPVHPNESDPE